MVRRSSPSMRWTVNGQKSVHLKIINLVRCPNLSMRWTAWAQNLGPLSIWTGWQMGGPQTVVFVRGGLVWAWIRALWTKVILKKSGNKKILASYQYSNRYCFNEHFMIWLLDLKTKCPHQKLIKSAYSNLSNDHLWPFMVSTYLFNLTNELVPTGLSLYSDC